MDITKIKSKIILLLIFLIILINLTGCWDAQPLEETFVVTGIGIDISENNPELLSITAFGPSFINEAEKPYVTFISEAPSIGKGLENIRNKTYRQVSISHTLVLIFCEELAKNGIRKYLDLFIRNAEIGSQLTVAVAKGRAANFLQAEITSNPNTAFFIQQLIETESRRININEFALRGVVNTLNERYSTLILPLLSMGQDKKQISLNEVVVFKRDKMIGKFGSGKITPLLMLRGTLERGTLEIGKVNPKGDGSKIVAFRIYPKKRRINVKVDNEGKVSVNMFLSIESDIYELEPPETKIDEKVLEDIATEAEKELQKRMLEIIEKLQKEYKIDAIGLSEYVRVKYPEYYAKIDWEDIFPDVDISVKVNMTVRQIGLTK